jgi:hypothetical protein
MAKKTPASERKSPARRCSCGIFPRKEWDKFGIAGVAWLKWDTQAINKAFHEFAADPDPFGAGFSVLLDRRAI